MKIVIALHLWGYKMQLELEGIPFELLEGIMIDMVRDYFGQELEERKLDVSNQNIPQNMLLENKASGDVVWPVLINEKPTDEFFVSLVNQAKKSEVNAILVISTKPRKFEYKVFKQSKRCWGVLAIWGKRQLESVLNMNFQQFSSKVDMAGHIPISSPNVGFGGNSKGVVIWSDIARFVQLSVDIGRKIQLDPVFVRKNLIEAVNRCFSISSSDAPTFSQKVGADGWFHFFDSTGASHVIPFTHSTMESIGELSRDLDSKHNEALTVVIGLNETSKLHLDPGGPFDDDSIQAYYLTHKNKNIDERYNVRGTEKIINNTIANLHSNETAHWTRIGTSEKVGGGGVINVYGHRAV